MMNMSREIPDTINTYMKNLGDANEWIISEIVNKLYVLRTPIMLIRLITASTIPIQGSLEVFRNCKFFVNPY